MKLFVGLCLTVALCLSVTAAADSGRSPRTVYLDNPFLSIGSGRIDVRQGSSLHIPEGFKRQDPDPYRLVKFDAPVGSRERTILDANGFEIVAYYPYNTFLVRPRTGASVGSLAGIEGVAWSGPFHPYFKIGRRLAERIADPPGTRDAAADGERFAVGLHDRRERGRVASRLAALPGVRSILPSHGPIRVELDPARIAESVQRIAALPGVAFIEPWWVASPSNDETVQSGQSGLCNAAGPEAPNTTIFNHGITGWNARIAVADTCFDANEGWFYDDVQGQLPAHEPSAPWTSVTPDWAQRKIVEYYDMDSTDTTLGCGGETGCQGSFGCADHGTHVAGTAAGNCSLDAEGVASATDPGNRDGDNDGMAPGARLIAQDLGVGLEYLNDDGGDLGELIGVAYANTCDGTDCGIDIHNNSWNAPVIDYETNSREADRELWNLRDLVVMVSAANGGLLGFDSVRAPAVAKNVIAVGSALPCSAHDLDSGSSRGAADDGRLKPDIVTSGDAVSSAQNDGDATTNSNGGCQIWVNGGTSMASAAAGGLAALTLQYYNDGFYPGGAANALDALDPSGPLLKATLINSAQRMTGVGAEQSGVTWPNMDQGWGYVALDRALHFAGESRNLWVHDEAVGVDVSGIGSMSFQRGITSSAEPLKVTLVWYDREHPGACGGVTPCLLNDLDLTVTNDTTGTSYTVTLVPGTPGHVVPRTVVPETPLPGQTSTDQGPDNLNTVEQIIDYTPSAPANYTFTVTAANTPDGAIPFALVASGALGEPCPAIASPQNNTAVDVAECLDNGVRISWDLDSPDWADGANGSRVYQVLRDGAPIPTGDCRGLLSYGTTSCVDDTAPNDVPHSYSVRYRSGCGAAVTTVGQVAADQTGPSVDVTPDGWSAICPGTPVLLSVDAAPGGGSYTFQWTENGEPIPGETSSTLMVNRTSPAISHFNCSVTDTVTGCIVEDPANAAVEWTTIGLAEVDYDVAFDPLPTLAESCGDGDSVVEAGEVWRVTTRLLNTASCGVAENARADLALNSGSLVSASVCGSTGYYGQIAGGGTSTHTYSFAVDQAAVCGEQLSLDVQNIWWGGGGVNAVESAIGFQVGQPATGNLEIATQFTDPLEATAGGGFSILFPGIGLASASEAQFDYSLSCHPGPREEIYSTPFPSLNGWTLTGGVSVDDAIQDGCPGSAGKNAHFAGDGTISRPVGTSNFAGIHIEANFRGGGQYTQPDECFKWWYSVDGGTEWVLYKDLCGAQIPDGSWTCAESFDFPPTADDNPDFELRFETTGGVDIRLDGLIVEGGALPCDLTNDVKVELIGPGSGAWTLKGFGDPDPAKPIDVTSFYNSAGGGPGIWRVDLDEAVGGTARIVGSELSVTDGATAQCDVSPSCSCPAGAPGEVSDDPDHLLRVGRSGATEFLRFEELGASSYNVYVSTEAGTSPFAVDAASGKKDCNVPSTAVPGGMRNIAGYDVESGIVAISDLHFILVTADDGAPDEGTPGYTSSSTARSLASACAN